MGTFDELYASLNPNAKKRGSEFELICRWFLQNDPGYAARLKHVWLWRQWPGRWSDVDAGIDLVAEDTDGKLWAIQAKARAERRRIPKRELDAFLAESGRPAFSYRLLITTTNAGLHSLAANMVAAQEKPVLHVDRNALRFAPVDWPEKPEDLQESPGDLDVGEPRIPGRTYSELPVTGTEDFVDALRVQDQGDPRWEQWFGLLERYVAEFGDARVPGDYSVGDQNLGRWVLQQRQRWAKGKLCRQSAERLQQLPGWVFNCHEAAWVDNYHLLAKYVSLQGNSSVPVGFEANGFGLGAWVVNQRTRHSAGKLEPHRVRRLEALPGWTWNPFQDTWDEGIRHLHHCGGAAHPGAGAAVGRAVRNPALTVRAGATTGRCRRPPIRLSCAGAARPRRGGEPDER